MQAEDLRVREELGASGSLAKATFLGWMSSSLRMRHVYGNRSNSRVAREAFGQRLAPPCLLAGPRPGNGMNYWFGYYRKHPREKLPAIVLRIC